MADGNHIGFSHDYSKLHGQSGGFLLSAKPYVLRDRWFSEETRQYDTDGVFPLPEGNYLQLVFLGEKEIPFTTYREDREDLRERFCKHVGEWFRFNFATGARKENQK